LPVSGLIPGIFGIVLIIKKFLSGEVFGGRHRAGEKKFVGQGLVSGCEERGVGGQQAILGGPLGRGHEAIDRGTIPESLHFAEVADEPVAHPGGLEDLVDVVFGGGFLGGLFDPVQEVVELEMIVPLQIVFETQNGQVNFLHQVLLMPEEGGDAEAELLAEGFKRTAAGQEMLVDGLALGVGTGFTLHDFLQKADD
jgi:hypothetical protein